MKIRRAVTWVLPLASPVLIAFLIGNVLHPATFAQHPLVHLKLGAEQESETVAVAPGTAKSQEGPLSSADGLAQFQRTFPGAAVPPDGYPAGIRAANHMVGPKTSVKWRELGPTFAPGASSENPITGKSTPVSGRSTSLAVVPSTCDQTACGTMYLGTATGGVWKTTDAGQTWQPLLDHAQTLSIGTIVLDPKNPDIVYVGTGEANHSGDSFYGIGILRSTDAGRTWSNLGYRQFVNRSVSAIVIDPRTAGSTSATIYAVSTRAVSGGAMTGGQDRYNNPYLPPVGFYVSKDGGKNWKESSPAPDGAQSLVMDPANPDVLYAGFNPDVTNPNNTSSPDALFGFSGLFRSIDDGANWLRLTNGLPVSDFDSIQVAIAPSNPQVIYAAFRLLPHESLYNSGNASQGHMGMYKSTDGGSSWTTLTNAPDACAIQCEYDMPVVVDPHNPDVVYVGGSANYDYLSGTRPECGTLYPLPALCHATVMKTTDGGNTWADVSENGGGGPLHPDDHLIVLAPSNSDVVYTVNDGGIFHSADGGKTWNDLNHGLGTLQFTGLAIGSDGAIYAGTQDNGTFKYTGSTTWQHIEGGDGGPTAVDPTNPNIVYKSNFGPFFIRNDHGGDPKYDVFIGGFLADYVTRGLGQFYEPYQIAPSKPSTIFYGTYRIWRSNLRGGVDGNNNGDATDDPSDKDDWVPISFDLRCNDQPVDPASTCNGERASGRNYGMGIASVAVSPINPNVVVAAASNGNIWLTRNALAAVKTDTSCSPFSNFLGIALCDYVSGPTWHRIGTGLPNRYPTSVKFAPGSTTKLYVAFSGFDKNTPHQKGHVFVSQNQGRTWRNLNGVGKRSSLPDLPFNDIVVNPNNGHLYVAADVGVFASSNGGHSWQRIDQTLPPAPVHQMQFDKVRNALAVATHGRGIWEVAAP